MLRLSMNRRSKAVCAPHPPTVDHVLPALVGSSTSAPSRRRHTTRSDISQLVPGVLGGRRCGRLYRYWWRALSFTLAFHLYPNALVFIGRHGRIRPPKDVGNNATLRPILRRRHCYAWIEAPTRRLMPRLRLRCVQKPLSIASRLQEEANQRVRPRPATVCRRSPRRRCSLE